MARKTYTCDCCGKERNHLVSMGRDSNGDPDSPDVCFFCRKENSRGRVYSQTMKRYIHKSFIYGA